MKTWREGMERVWEGKPGRAREFGASGARALQIICAPGDSRDILAYANAERFHPAVSVVRDRGVFALVLVRDGVLPLPVSPRRLPFARVVHGGIRDAVSDRAPPRIRPRARVPAGRRPGKPDRPLAVRRRRLRPPASTSRRHALGHRRRTARERDPPADPRRALAARLLGALVRDASERLSAGPEHGGHQSDWAA